MKRTLSAAIVVASVAAGLGIATGTVSAEEGKPESHYFVMETSHCTVVWVVEQWNSDVNPGAVSRAFRASGCTGAVKVSAGVLK